MKKVIYIALALLLLGGLAYAIVRMQQRSGNDSANDKEKSSIKYVVEETPDGVLVIHEPLTEIEPYAFQNTHAKRVVLPEGLKKIGDYAFVYSDIKEIEIPGSVDTIGNGAFSCCQLIKLKLNEGLEYIGSGAFERCETLNQPFTLPSTVKYIGSKAFGYAPETEVDIERFYEGQTARNIVIPENSQLEFVGYEALNFAKELFVPKSLKSVSGIGHPYFRVPKDHPQFCSIDGILYSKDTTVLVSFPQERGGTYVMPNSVRVIDEYAFEYNTVLEKIVLSNHLDSIKPKPLTLMYKNLKEVNIHNNPNFKSIDGVLFNRDLSTLIYYPQGLKSNEYKVPEHVKTIGESAFMYTQTKRIVMPKNLKEIQKDAFNEPRSVECLLFTGPYDFSSSIYDVFQDGQYVDSVIFRDQKVLHEETDGETDANEEEAEPRTEVSCPFAEKPNYGMKLIDLGLPSGNLWAETNLAADTCFNFGKTYNWEENITDFVIQKEVEGASHLKIPTNADWQELIDNCYWDKAILGYWIVGYLVRGKNGKTIFLPIERADLSNHFKAYYDAINGYSLAIGFSEKVEIRDSNDDEEADSDEDIIELSNNQEHNFFIRPICPSQR